MSAVQPKTRRPRSDKGTSRPNPAQTLAELTMYVNASLEVIEAINERIAAMPDRSAIEAMALTFNEGQLAACRAMKARLA